MKEIPGQPSVILVLCSTDSWHIIFLTYWLKPLNLGVVCFILIDNWNTRWKHFFALVLFCFLPAWNRDTRLTDLRKIWRLWEKTNKQIHTYLLKIERVWVLVDTVEPSIPPASSRLALLEKNNALSAQANIILMFCYLPLNTSKPDTTINKYLLIGWLTPLFPNFSKSVPATG